MTLPALGVGLIAGHKLVKELLEEVSDTVVLSESAGSLLTLVTQFTP